jgi:hypothetical protein
MQWIQIQGMVVGSLFLRSSPIQNLDGEHCSGLGLGPIRHPFFDKGPDRPLMSYEGKGGSNRFEPGWCGLFIPYAILKKVKEQKSKQSPQISSPGIQDY